MASLENKFRLYDQASQRRVMLCVMILVSLGLMLIYPFDSKNECPEHHTYNQEEQTCTVKSSIVY